MPLTIVTYHYVRDTEQTPFPGIKGLPVDEFRGQIDYLQRHYTFVRQEEVVAALAGDGADIPANAVVLTFDDGYIDHFVSVLPILSQRGLQGLFFPAAKPVLEGTVLDVNKVHFVLSTVEDKNILVQAVRDAVAENRDEYDLAPIDTYWSEYAKASRFDPAEVIFFKRMLQKALPEPLRTKVLDLLFHTHVSADEASFASELYMSMDQLKTMVDSGMYVGCHGYAHHWMERLSADAQRLEISRALEFLATIGAPTTDWAICYPYGSHNDSLVQILRENGCAFGLAWVVDVVDMKNADPYRLPRLDTNDLPKSADHPISPWTQKVLPR